MEQNELNRILAQGEGLRIEFKKAQSGVPDSLYDTVASFLNREGGIILSGVDDTAKVLGLPIQNLMQFKQDIVTFNVLTWADEIGSGIKNMNKFVSTYTDGAHPIFIEDDPFKSIIPMQLLKVGERYKLFLHLSRLQENQLNDERILALKELPLGLSFKNTSDLNELPSNW